MKFQSSAELSTGLIIVLALLVAAPIRVQAMTFNIPAGDVAALKTAIQTSNGNGQDDIINLAANATYILGPLADLDSTTQGLDGLRAILPDGGHRLTINGNGATIARSTAPSTADFRIFYFSPLTQVALNRLTIQNDFSGGFRGIDGGGIFNMGTLNLSNCTLSQNSVGELGNGGGIYNDGGTLNLSNCTLSQNYAHTGSGIYNDGGTLNLSNCTLSQNRLSGFGSGGGIYNDGGTLNLSNCTLSEHIVANLSGRGGGIYISGKDATVELGSTILATSSIFNDGNEGTVISNGFNISNDDAGGFLTAFTDRINTDPKLSLAGLKNNRGPTATIELQSNSPALDNGKDLSLTHKDQRGLPRPVNFKNIANVVGGDGSDIGAFETQKLPLTAVNVVPVSLNIVKSHLLVFSSANGTEISLFDADIGDVPVSVTLSVTGGTLTLSKTERLSFTGGDGIADATMTFSGTPDIINAALEGMTYTPDSSTLGLQLLTISTTTPTGIFTDSAVIEVLDTGLATDVSSQMRITRSGFRLNRATQRYQQNVLIVNAGAFDVAGPVSLVLDGLSRIATLVRMDGVTAATLPVGSPYLNLNIGLDGKLSPGESTTAILEFNDPSNGGIIYASRVLAGQGTR